MPHFNTKLAAIDFGSLESMSAYKFQGKTLGNMVSALLIYVFPIAGLILLLYLIYGGYKYMLSRGDPKSLEQAKGIITTAVIGFIIVFISYWVVQIVGLALGLTDITNVFK